MNKVEELGLADDLYGRYFFSLFKLRSGLFSRHHRPRETIGATTCPKKMWWVVNGRERGRITNVAQRDLKDLVGIHRILLTGIPVPDLINIVRALLRFATTCSGKRHFAVFSSGIVELSPCVTTCWRRLWWQIRHQRVIRFDVTRFGRGDMEIASLSRARLPYPGVTWG